MHKWSCLRLDGVEVSNRVDGTVDVCDHVVLHIIEAAKQVEDDGYLADVSQELIAESSPFAGSADQSWRKGVSNKWALYDKCEIAPVVQELTRNIHKF